MHNSAILFLNHTCRRHPLRPFVLVLMLLAAVPIWLPAQVPPEAQPQSSLFIVRLRHPSLVEHLDRTEPKASDLKVLARSRPAEDYETQLRTEHQDFIARVSAEKGLSVLGDCTYLINVVFVRATPAAVDLLTADPEVSAVYPSQARYPVLDGAVGMVHAEALWDNLGGISEAGRGIKIGIVDSGINQEHPMFGGNGLVAPQGFPKVDGDRPQDLEFTNNKVIVARSFSYLFPVPPTREGDLTPADQLGHGSRVASIAAGRVTEAPEDTTEGAVSTTIEGIAPMAFLGNYKIFGSGVNASTTSDAVAAAIDQAARDGMDVINLSIGGSAAEPGTSPEQEAIANAVRLGIVVVAAAGNLGPNAETVTFPGSSPDVITVGAISNARVFAPDIEVSAPVDMPADLQTIAYIPGQGVNVATAIGPLPIVSMTEWDPSGEACSPPSIPEGDLSGKIVLVKRGTCTFREKSENVFDAGARAMVVFNNVRGRAIQMGNVLTTSPSIMIERGYGEALETLIKQTPAPGVTVLVRSSARELRLPAAEDELAAFSGRGPNVDGSLKPDLVAVGTDFFTATNVAEGPDAFSQHSNGTSFATPMVTGAAALMRQLHDDWTVEAIKSALVSTAVKTPYIGDQPAHLAQMGGGRLDLSRLADVDSFVEPASISFGLMSGIHPTESRVLMITNRGPAPRQYSLHFEPWLDTPDAVVGLSPDSFSLGSGETGEIDVTLDVAGLPDGGTAEGFLVISESAGEPELTVPIWGALVTEDPDTTLTVSQQDPSAFRTLAEAIQAARPGNLIEITDSGTYYYQGTLRTNDQGVPLNGLQIRSRSGETPTIDGSGTSLDAPIITVSGLQRVTLEGLHFRGGLYGIEFSQATGVIKNCVVETVPSSSLGFGIRLSGGSRVHVYGNSVTGAGGPAISVLDSQAVIQHNRIGDQTAGGSISGSGVDLNDSDPTALFDNSLQGGSASQDLPGVSMTLSSVFAKGNQIRGFAGETGDGIRAGDSLSHLETVANVVSDNGRAGILVRGGASADLRRDRILRNGSAGLRLETGASLTGRAETLFENNQGVVAVGATLGLSDSLVAFSTGKGIVATTSTVQLLNDTVFGNGGAGVSVNNDPNTPVLVANSISVGNSPGQDLVGIAPSASSHNLTSEQEPAGGGASSGSGPLDDPANGDFSPAVGSSAIDRGDNDYASAFGTDLAGHQRVVDGDGSGTSEVDIGALEYASHSSPPLILPLADPVAGDFIGLALTNAETRSAWETAEPAAIELTERADDGSLAENAETQLEPMSQLSRLVRELLIEDGGVEKPGWLEVLPDRPDIVGFTLVGDYRMTRLDGIALGDPPAPVQILPEVRTSAGFFTRIFVVNPTSSPAKAALRWISPGAQPVTIENEDIAPGGRLAVSLAELIGDHDDGYLEVESTSGTPLSSMEIFGTDSTIAALSGFSPDRASKRLFGPQLAITPAMGSEIDLVNLGDAGDVTLEAFAESGQRVGKKRTIQLGEGEQWRGQAAQLFADIDELVGWLRVSSDQGRLIGCVTFSDPSGRQMASLPLQETGARESIFSHVAQTPQIFTGLTLLNPESTPTLISIEVFDQDGTLAGTALSELGPGEKRARLLSEWIPSLSSQTGGFVRVRANRAVLGFELFGSTAYLAAVPQQVVSR